jgi:virginiamycin B lyase
MYRSWHLFLKAPSRQPCFTLRARPSVERLEDRCVPSGGIQEFLIPTAGSGPVGITSGPDGALWFTENATNQIGRVTTAGVVSNVFSIPTSGSDPDGIAAGPDGALWFTEFFGNKIGRITTAGVVTNEFPILTPSGNPKGITVGSDNKLWFVEEQGNKVGQITTAGVVTEFSLAAGSNPIAIVSGPDHNLWVTESGTGKIAVLDTSGNLLHEFSLPTTGGSPQGITVGPDSNLWFTEQAGNRVGRITTAGVVTEFPLPQAGSGPEGIAAGADGALWFSEGGGSRVGRITTGGSISEFATPTSASHPAGITLGPNNALWFVERDANQVAQLVPDQTLTATGLAVTAGDGVPFTAAVASFTDADSAATAAGFQATIVWGDSSSSTGGVASDGHGGFVVTGSHNYAIAGSLPVTVTITDIDSSHDVGGATATANTTANVALSSLPGFTGTQNQRWLAHVYLDLLGRGMDAAGLSNWSGLLDNGMSPFQVVQKIESSPEYRMREVEGLYQRFLGRAADPQGLGLYMAYLATGRNIGGLEAFFLSSKEFVQKHGAANNWIYAVDVFQAVVGRPASSADEVYFGKLLDHGMSRDTLAATLLHTAEALGDRVQGLYSLYLRRGGEAGGVVAWRNDLAHGMSDDVITAGFVASEEYFTKV